MACRETQDGIKIEKEFKKFEEGRGNIVKNPTSTENMVGHWDFDVNGEKIDVKGPKNYPRYLENGDLNPFYNNDWVVLELKSKNNGIGSIYGDAGTIVFCTSRYWIYVKTKALRKLVKQRVTNFYVDSIDLAAYCLFSRKDEKDLMTVVSVQDIMRISYDWPERKDHRHHHVVGTSILTNERLEALRKKNQELFDKEL